MTTRPPVFTPQISVGNILQILVLGVAMAAAWYTMENRSQNNSVSLENIAEDVREIDNRLKIVEIEQARADERFASVLTLLSRIDTRLERIEANQ